jgi:hypothetical protein
METTTNELDEKRSIILIREMIDVSSRNIKKDGIVLLVWGLIGCIMQFLNFYPEIKLLPKLTMKLFNVAEVILMAGAILFTVAYIYQNRKRPKTYISITARYLWIGIIVAYNLITILIKQKTGTVDFELLHPMQMTLIGLALFVTGGLYREKLLNIGGVVYWIVAFIAVKYTLPMQFVFEFMATLAGFVVPGAYLYYQSQRHVSAS